MSVIPHSTLILLAVENFKRVKALAASSKPGCKIARKHLAEAAKHGLDKRAYAVLDGTCCGWDSGRFISSRIGGVPRIAPLFGR